MACDGYDCYPTDISTWSSQEVDFLFRNSVATADFERGCSQLGIWSSQEVDFLFRNSVATADFERGFDNPKMKDTESSQHYEDAGHDSTSEWISSEFVSSFTGGGTSLCNRQERGTFDEQGLKESEAQHFDDTSSWSTDHSEVMVHSQLENVETSEFNKLSRSSKDILHQTTNGVIQLSKEVQLPEGIIDSTSDAIDHHFDYVHDFEEGVDMPDTTSPEIFTLHISKEIFSRKKDEIGCCVKEVHNSFEKATLLSSPKSNNTTKGTRLCRSLLVEDPNMTTAAKTHSKVNDTIVAGGSLTNNQKESPEVKVADMIADMSRVEKDAKAREKKLLELTKENRRVAEMLKEHEKKVTNFAKEKALWEQKKVSEMNMFNTFKEEETRRLKKERTRLEKQAKLLLNLPSKKERNEVEELNNKIASITADHCKKDSLQKLTINRLRRTIGDLTEQIHGLQEEVKRYENFLQAEWDSQGERREMYQMQRTTNTTLDGSSANRLTTRINWTKA